MYPSSNSCSYSPIFSSLFNIPFPSMEYEHELLFQYYQHHLLQHSRTPLTTANDQNILDDALAETSINMADSDKDTVIICNELEEEEVKGFKNNKRASKEDRHSKINTAKGPRDRRVRLSIDIARRFFSLQDILRFEKASKTVEWLLIKSKPAIKELYRGPLHMSKQSNSASSTSECEILSGIDESPSNNQNHKKNAKGNSCKKEKKKAKSARIRAAFHHPFAKESRKQARERTKLKKIFGESRLRFEATAHDLNIRSGSTRGKQSGQLFKIILDSSRHTHPCHEMQAEVEELTSHNEKQLLLWTKENTIDND